MQISMPYSPKNKHRTTDSIRGIYPTPQGLQTTIQKEITLPHFSSTRSSIQVWILKYIWTSEFEKSTPNIVHYLE